MEQHQQIEIFSTADAELQSHGKLPKKTSRRRIWLCLRGFGGDQPLPNLAHLYLSHFKPDAFPFHYHFQKYLMTLLASKQRAKQQYNAISMFFISLRSLLESDLYYSDRLITVGQTTDEIDVSVFNMCIENGAYPSPLNYKNFPKSVCTSVNNIACHGIPDDRPLADGDIINVDVTGFPTSAQYPNGSGRVGPRHKVASLPAASAQPPVINNRYKVKGMCRIRLNLKCKRTLFTIWANSSRATEMSIEDLKYNLGEKGQGEGTLGDSVFFNGYHGDCSTTFLVGNVDDKGKNLVKATEICLYEAINICKPGQYFAAIGRCIEDTASKLEYQVIPAFIGHGIGHYFHGPPDIYHISYKGTYKIRSKLLENLKHHIVSLTNKPYSSTIINRTIPLMGEVKRGLEG
ncbi:hypothetical protein NQ317_014118 [Molorchus minor]|uniref:Peptidase M24 domain-containing protein n=1 Tax=Molorchus minor TaxID=1323400 RepID=A0ABQ9JMH5_9CUCU|nr:hypothetical protein NQ317_014118 [Molorchus minor]